MKDDTSQQKDSHDQSIDWSFLRPYLGWSIVLVLVVMISNGLNLMIPRLVGTAIDSFDPSNGELTAIWSDIRWIVLSAVGVLIFAIAQAFLAAWIAEKVARDFREKLVQKISRQSVGFIDSFESGRLYTMITSDTEAVKNIISLGLVNILSALIILVGSVILLFSINVRLASFAVISLPFMVVVFGWVFRNISQYFKKSQEVLERINQVINESVTGSMLVRVLFGQEVENIKFVTVNTESRDIGYRIIDLFSVLLPAINLLSNFTIVVILYFGGRQVIGGGLSVGDFSAFVSYVNLLVTPIFILGFVSNIISRSFVSLKRLGEVLNAPDHDVVSDGHSGQVKGSIVFENVSLELGGRMVLNTISFELQAGKRNAIVGPTAAGKSLIMYLMAGIIQPTQGTIRIDGVLVKDWDQRKLFEQIGLVFQESVLFRTSLRENIVFDREIPTEQMDQYLHIAHLDDVIKGLDAGLETIVSERGTNLSGGQKQRVMLARALAIDPKILLLDDFTARVDIHTEREIISRLAEYSQDITLVSISQKLESVKDFDTIVVLMEGELIGQGTHLELLENSLEYGQIWNSQQTSP